MEIVKLLLRYGANLDMKDKEYGRTPFFYACIHRHFEVAKLLIKMGKLLYENGGRNCNVRAKGKDGDTALHQSACLDGGKNMLEVAKFLIDNGAQVNAKNNEGDTALHHACGDFSGGGRFELIKLLVKNGADPNAKNNSGQKPLDLANKYNSSVIAELLIRNGTDDDNTNK